MIDELSAWTWIVLALLAAASGLRAVHKRPRTERRRCRGRHSLLCGIVDPLRWFSRGSCWYDLSGLAIDSRGKVRCPECGSESLFASMPIDGARCRWATMSFTAFIAAAVIFAVSWARGGTWARPLPMSVLALMDRSRFKSVGMTVRDEVDRRIDQGEFTPWSTTLLLHSLAKDLRSDERRFNAERGIDLLEKLWPQSRNELERCLSTGDAQSRILAARVLRKRCTTPTPALLKACVEDLRDDSIQVRWYLSLGNAREACDYLLEHAAAAEDLLVQAMRSEDRQQQLLSAAILGFANRVDQIDRAAPILIHHLRNNDIGGDAKIAAPALYRFGSAALPYLSAHIDSDDAQLRAAARSIVEQIEHPDRLIHELDNPMPRLSVLTHDPLNTQSLAEIAGDVRWPARQKR